MVHHKKHLTPDNIWDPDITLDWKNLEALCIDCHNKEHNTAAGCDAELAFDDMGNLVKRVK
jgi:5-methylcytosine-specific restriction endonuclease McrA